MATPCARVLLSGSNMVRFVSFVIPDGWTDGGGLCQMCTNPLRLLTKPIQVRLIGRADDCG